MAGCAGMRIVVAGAGAVGSVAALALARAGAEVLLADPAAAGANASGVAAGMLAPAMESALDPLSHGHYGLLRRSRDAWPGLAESIGAPLHRCGALWFAADGAERAAVWGRLVEAGAVVEELAPDAAEGLSPGLSAPGAAIHTGEDWRLDPISTLAALHRALEAAGGRRVHAALTAFDAGRARLSTGEFVSADLAVLASGGKPAEFVEAPAELASLDPIKGQIVRFPGVGPRSGPIVRHASGYVVPGAEGPFAGATMEAGRGDLGVDPATVCELTAAAAGLFPKLAKAAARGAAGVRYGAPDGLPVVGASSRPGVFLALGARRNGWLLAPLISEALLGAIHGEAMPAFAPRRFLSSA